MDCVFTFLKTEINKLFVGIRVVPSDKVENSIIPYISTSIINKHTCVKALSGYAILIKNYSCVR